MYGEKPVAVQTAFEEFLLTTDPNDAEMVEQLSTRDFQDDALVSVRYGIRLGDGTKRQLRLRGLAVQGRDGSVERVVGVVQTVREPGGSLFSPLIPVRGPNGCRQGTIDLHPPARSVRSVELDSLGSGKSSILLVEDNTAVRALVRMILSNGGFSVLEASRGDDAVSSFRESPFRPRLMIVDVGLPGLSGIQVAEALWESDPELPVLFLSGYDEGDVELPDRDCAAFLRKPFGTADLLSSVLGLLSEASS